MLVEVRRGFNAKSHGWLTFSLSRHVCVVNGVYFNSGRPLDLSFPKVPRYVMHIAILAGHFLHGGKKRIARNGDCSDDLIGIFTHLPLLVVTI